MPLTKAINYLNKQSKTKLTVYGLMAVFGIGFFDYITGSDLSFSFFYLIPISLITWFIGKKHGIFLSIVGSITWLIAELMWRLPHEHTMIPYWNSILRLLIFIGVTFLITKIRDSNLHLEDLVKKRTEELEKSQGQLEKRVQERTVDLGKANKNLEEQIENRKQIEENLKKNEQRLSEAQELAHLGSWEWDIVKNTVYWSDELHRIFGYKPGEIKVNYESFLMHNHPDDKEFVNHVVKSSIQNIQPFSFDHRIIRPDGEVRFLHATGNFICDSDKKPVRLVGTSHDITDRKLAELRLSAQFAITRILADAGTIQMAIKKILEIICESLQWDFGAYWVYDKDLNELHCDSIWCMSHAKVERFGEVSESIRFIPGKGIPGRVWASGNPVWLSNILQFSNYQREKVAQECGLHGAFGFPVILEGRILGVIEFFSRHIRQPDENMLNMFNSIGSQIGQFLFRKMAEIELQKSYQELEKRVADRTAELKAINLLLEKEITERKQAENILQASEEKFRQVSETISEVFWMTDPTKKKMIYVSPAYEKVWGRSCESLYLNPLSWFEVIHPEDQDKVQESLKVQMEGKYDVEYRILRPDGTIRWVRDRAFPIKNNMGEVYRVTGIAEDITERKRTEEIEGVFTIMKEELSESTAPKDAGMVILKAADKLCGWDACSIIIYTEENDTVKTLVCMDTEENKRKEFFTPSEKGPWSPIFYKTLREGPQLLLRSQPPPTGAEKLRTFGNHSQRSESLMYVPIRKQKKNIGVLTIQSYTPNAYTKKDLDLLQILADHCSGALTRAFAEETLRQSENKYRLLVEQASDGIFLINENGKFVTVNSKGCEMLGYSEDEILDMHIVDTYLPEDRELCLQRTQKIRNGELTQFERYFLRKDGTILPVDVSIRLLSDGNTQAIVRDITIRKQAEEITHQRNRELAVLNNVSAALSSSLELPQILVTLKTVLSEQLEIPGGVIFFYDDSADRLTQEIGWGLPDIVLEKIKAIPVKGFLNENVIRKKETVHHLDFHKLKPFSDLHWNGSRNQWKSCLSVPMVGKGQIQGVMCLFSKEPKIFNEKEISLLTAIGHEVGVTIHNATLYEQVRIANQQLQTLSRRLVQVQEKERHHVARELHDEIGQSLTGLKLMLGSISRLPNDQLVEHVNASQELINDLIKRVRNISLNLRPAMLDDLGLLSTLVWLFERYTDQTQIQVVFQHKGIEKHCCPTEVESAIYRIVQEAITNVARYAQVHEVFILLSVDNKKIDLLIEDHGIGFVPNPAKVSKNSTGISGMRERAILAGGIFTIHSSPNAGTRIRVQFPIFAEEPISNSEYQTANSESPVPLKKT